MNLRSGVVMGMLLATSAVPAFAASFEVPRNFEIMYVDLESPGRFGGDFHTEVEGGEHQFVVRFNQRVGGGSNAEQFQSEPYIIDINMAEDAEIVLKAPYFFRKDDAAQFAKNTEFSLVNETTDSKPEYEVRMLPVETGVTIMRNYKREVKDFTATYKQPKVDSPVPASASAPATEELEMLKFWFNKADAATRKDIRIWMIDQSHQPQTQSTAYEMMNFWFEKASKEDQKAFQVWLLNE